MLNTNYEGISLLTKVCQEKEERICTEELIVVRKCGRERRMIIKVGNGERSPSHQSDKTINDENDYEI